MIRELIFFYLARPDKIPEALNDAAGREMRGGKLKATLPILRDNLDYVTKVADELGAEPPGNPDAKEDGK